MKITLCLLGTKILILLPLKSIGIFGVYLRDEGSDPKVFVQQLWKDASLNKINRNTF